MAKKATTKKTAPAAPEKVRLRFLGFPGGRRRQLWDGRIAGDPLPTDQAELEEKGLLGATEPHIKPGDVLVLTPAQADSLLLQEEKAWEQLAGEDVPAGKED